MPVAMRPSERVRYRKHIPQEEFATTPLRCRYYDLILRRLRALVSSWATALMWPGRTIRPRHLNGGALLSYVQPFRIVAPYGVVVDALVGGRAGLQATGGLLRHPGAPVRRARGTRTRGGPLRQGADPVRRVLLPLPPGAAAVRLNTRYRGAGREYRHGA